MGAGVGSRYSTSTGGGAGRSTSALGSARSTGAGSNGRVGSKSAASAGLVDFADFPVFGVFALGAAAVLGVTADLVRVRRERDAARFFVFPAESAVLSALGLSSDEGGGTSIKGMPRRRVVVEGNVAPGG